MTLLLAKLCTEEPPKKPAIVFNKLLSSIYTTSSLHDELITIIYAIIRKAFTTIEVTIYYKYITIHYLGGVEPANPAVHDRETAVNAAFRLISWCCYLWENGYQEELKSLANNL